jgi:MFS family permease
MSRDSSTSNNHRFPYSADVSASVSIIIARVFYAVNWFNVAAIFPLLVLDFGQHDIGLLGSISAAFFIGVGMFQVPAGIFAARYSPRSMAIFGIGLSSSAALLYGFTSEASQLIWLRFIVGAGMALFFSSGVVLIAKHAGGTKKSSGFSIGLLNSAHSAGGIIGLFGWIVIAQMVGWRSSLVLSGAIGIATALLMIIAIPSSAHRRPISKRPPPPAADAAVNNNYSESRDIISPSPPEAQAGGNRWPDISEIWGTLSNPSLIALGLVLTGIQASWALLLTFTIVYLQSLNIQLESAGVIASMALISAIVSAPLIGGYYDKKVKDSRKILLACGVGISAALAAMSIQILSVIIIAVIALGFFSGGAFTVAYAKARTIRTTARGRGQDERNNSVSLQHEERRGEDTSSYSSADKNKSSYNSSALNVAWINGLSLIGILWMPLVFSLAVKSGGGYSNAWLLSAILAALFMFIPLQKVEK